MKLNLQARYSITIVALIILIVFILAGILLFQFGLSLNQLNQTSAKAMSADLLIQMRKRGEALTKLLAENLVNPLYNYDMQTIYELLAATKSQPDVLYALVYGPDARILHDGKEKIPQFGEMLDDEASKKAITIKEQLVTQVQDEILSVSMSIWIGDTPLGGVKVGISLKSINSDIAHMNSRLETIGKAGVRRIINLMVLTTVLLILAGVILSISVSRRLIRPIRQLAHYAIQIGKGNYDVRTSYSRNDEIGDLINSFSKMSLDLQRTTVSKKYFEGIINSMNDSLTILTSGTTIYMANRATVDLLGYEEGELDGRLFETLFPKRLAPDVSRWLNQLLHKGVVNSTDTIYLTKSGKEIHILLSGSYMYGEGENFEGLVFVAQDITERKLAEQSLQHAYQELKEAQVQLVQSAKLASIGELAAGVAHELNQPLMVIRGMTQLIQRSLQNGNLGVDELVDLVEPLERNTSRMIKIIKHLGTFSRQSQGQFTAVDINQVIEDSFMLMGEQLVLHNIEVKKKFGANLPHIHGDANQLEQVLLNLMTNSRDAIETKRQMHENNAGSRQSLEIITRLVNADSQFVDILFTDTGCGFKPENLGKIFDPFFTTKEAGKGTGLGLSISYGIIKDHKGDIQAIETSPDGTTFRIRLPAK